MDNLFRVYANRFVELEINEMVPKMGGDMKRKLYFFLEKLEIKRSERIAISCLLILLVLLSTVWTFQKPPANYDEEQYRKLEKIFKERSKQLQNERDLILARYEPTEGTSTKNYEESNEPTVVSDTTDENEEEDPAVELLNINTATNQQLQELPGIGPAYARRIIQWREENGNFTTKDQLLEIKGIGEKRLARIKPLVTL